MHLSARIRWRWSPVLWYDSLLAESSLKLRIVIILKCGRCMRTKQDNHNRNQHLYLAFMQLNRISQQTRKCLVLSSFKEFRKRPAPSWYRGYYTVARRFEFYFEVTKQYFTNERSDWVKYCFSHEKIKFISSGCRRAMFFLLYREKYIHKIIAFYSTKSNCDDSNLKYSNIKHC